MKEVESTSRYFEVDLQMVKRNTNEDSGDTVELDRQFDRDETKPRIIETFIMNYYKRQIILD